MAAAYGCSVAKERYYCNFGVNPAFAQILLGDGVQGASTSAITSRLLVTGSDSEGEVRVLEAPPPHPFFVGTLFVPQALSTPERPHPLVSAFLRAAAAAAITASLSILLIPRWRHSFPSLHGSKRHSRCR